MCKRVTLALLGVCLLSVVGLVHASSETHSLVFKAKYNLNRKLLQTNWGQVPFPWLSNGPSPSSTPGDGAAPTSTSATSSSDTVDVTNSSGDEQRIPGAYNDTIPECPKITLRLDTIEVYDAAVNDPNGVISVQCYTRTGKQFPPITFYSIASTVRSSLGARYTPNADVAQLACGEEASCRIAVGRTTRASPESPATVGSWRELVEGGCWFDYRHFTQLSYREQMSAWTCNRPPTRYTLECVECAQPDFPWDLALASGGAPLSETGSTSPQFNFNSTMIVVSIVVCSVAVVLVGLALFVRHRRRAIEHDRRMMEMIEQARESRQRPRGHKPAVMFVVGEATTTTPPAEYKGPIVVINVGEDEQSEAEEGSLPPIYIAKQELTVSSLRDGEPSSSKHRERLSSHRSRSQSGSSSSRQRSSSGYHSQSLGYTYNSSTNRNRPRSSNVSRSRREPYHASSDSAARPSNANVVEVIELSGSISPTAPALEDVMSSSSFTSATGVLDAAEENVGASNVSSMPIITRQDGDDGVAENGGGSTSRAVALPSIIPALEEANSTQQDVDVPGSSTSVAGNSKNKSSHEAQRELTKDTMI